MRKILLGTTAVVGAALLAPGAFAQTTRGGGGAVGQGVPVQAPAGAVGVAPTPLNVGPNVPATQVVVPPAPRLAGAGGLSVRLGGYFAFTGAYVMDDNDYARTRNARGGINNAQSRQRYDFRNDLELNVFIDGRASNGMTYGAVFEFQIDNTVTTSGDGTAVSMDEAYGFLSFPNLGTLRFGQEDSAASLLQVRAPGSQALGGDAEWDEFIIQQGLYSSPYLISGINDGNDATKIIYLSPQFAGFDFGASYAFNNGEGERVDYGTSSPPFQRDRTNLTNEISAGIRYRGTFGPMGLQAGFGAMTADPAKLSSAGVAINPQAQQVYAYTVGLAMQAYGFSLGGEYTFGQYNGGSVGRSAANAGLSDSSHYLIGATYTLGPVVFGGVFGQAFQDNGIAVSRQANGVVTSVTSLNDRTHTIWGVGVAYNLAPGLVLFALYNNVNDENIPTSAPSNGLYGGSGTTLASFNGSNTRTINVGIAGIRLAF